MNDYKVPQDVEAEDKLLGPFNFRQFIYLIVVALAGFGAFGLFQIFPPLVIIPIPFILFFGALALPLRKDQPMEIYLAAVLSYYLKPRKRIWKPDGVEHLIEITAPNIIEPSRTKDISRDEAVRRLSYLSDVVDTGGWAIKHAVSQNSSMMHDDVFNEAQKTEDIYEDNRVADNIDKMIALNDQRRKREILTNMNTARGLADYTTASAEEIQAQTYVEKHIAETENYQTEGQPQPVRENPANADIFGNIHVEYNPYPNSMRQSVIKPLSEQEALSQVQQIYTEQPASSSQVYQGQPAIGPQLQVPAQQSSIHPKERTQTPEEIASAKQANNDIMRLVSEGKDLTVETIARQAKKIHEKHEREIDAQKQHEGELDEEVVISLR